MLGLGQLRAVVADAAVRRVAVADLRTARPRLERATKTWSWTAAPANNGLPAAYRCGVDGDRDGRAAQSATSCQVPNAKAGDRVWLDVEVAGVTATIPEPMTAPRSSA